VIIILSMATCQGKFDSVSSVGFLSSSIFFAFLQHWPRYSARTFGYTIDGRGADGVQVECKCTNVCMHAPCHHVEKKRGDGAVPRSSPRDSPIKSSSRPEPKSRPVIVIAKQNCGTTRRAIMIMIPYRLYSSGVVFPRASNY
jgi:hypothetical protein